MKVLITRLLLVLDVCNEKPTYRKSWAGNLGVVIFHLRPPPSRSNEDSHLKSAHNSLIIGRTGLGWQTNLQEIMGQESFDVVRFDLGPLLQGQTRILKLKSAYISLIIGPRGLQCETNL